MTRPAATISGLVRRNGGLYVAHLLPATYMDTATLRRLLAERQA